MIRPCAESFEPCASSHAVPCCSLLASVLNLQAQFSSNDGSRRNHWLQVRLVGVESNRDGIGARVTVSSDDLVQVAERTAGGSYQAAHDPRLHSGLGVRNAVSRVEVVWPSGTVNSLQADRTVVIEEGVGLHLPDGDSVARSLPPRR